MYQAKAILQGDDFDKIDEVVTLISKHIRHSMITKQFNVPPIRYRKHIDGMTRKKRIIGVQHPLHQIYDYVAVNGMKEVLDKKIGVFQVASIPTRGQAYGKKYIERWTNQTDRQLYFAKGDITKCFPSISHKLLKEQLARDIKNDDLLWLLYELIDMFDEGLSIGSYLSQYLSNYYLSQAYHFISNDLFRTRTTKSGEVKRIRLIKHVLFYMDDLILIGHNKRDLRKAMNETVKFMNDTLELEVKGWKVCKLSGTEPIDMMGFVFRRGRTTIRERIFLKTRRNYHKAQKHLDQNGYIPLGLAYSCISAYGWYKNTDSYQVMEKNNINALHDICRQTIAAHARKEIL